MEFKRVGPASGGRKFISPTVSKKYNQVKPEPDPIPMRGYPLWRVKQSAVFTQVRMRVKS